MEIYERLRQRAAEKNPIRVGLVGCGQMGSGLVHVTNQIVGMETTALADIDVDRPLTTLQALGIPEAEICITNSHEAAEDAMSAGKFLVTEDAPLLAKLEGLDAVVEATGSTEVGSKVAWSCILNSKHIILLNVETDVTVGPLLHRLAKKAGCVYTAASGDEPGACKTMYNFASAMGFEVICLGKGKNNPIDFDATPASCRQDALAKGMNPKMLSGFRDGTKTMVELAAISNATGLLPDVPGMHGPQVDVPDLNKVLIPVDDGGILSQRGCVDYSTGRVAPGVFAIVTTPDPRIQVDMQFVSMGDGPYYTFYRPYHLCNIETPISIAEAVIYGEGTIASTQMVSEVVPIAKRDLKPGQVVGEIGCEDFLGRIYTFEESRSLRAIPLGIVPGGRVTSEIAKGQILAEDNFAPDPDKFVCKLRRMQDAQLAMEGRNPVTSSKLDTP
jgi:predicted homoserine dehydrogenase-like protein